MDKSRDGVKRGGRGASRLLSRQIINKQSGHNKLFSGSEGGEDLIVPLEYRKKQRLVKKLSAVNRARSINEENFEMGCDMSDRDIEFPTQSHSSMCNNGTTGKRFKLPKKFTDDCSGVDHASVPRKLRSAMKKRIRESLSPPLPDSKKLNHTIGLGVPKKDGRKKSKLSMKQGSSDWSTKHAAGPITKDEEEVAETLYALAGMFPDNDSNDKGKSETTPSEAKLPALPDCKESPTPVIEDSAVTKVDVNSTCPLKATESTIPSSNVENSVKEIAGVDSLYEPGVQEQPDSNDCKNLNVKSEICIPQVNLHSMISSFSKTQHNDDKPSYDPVKFHLLPKLNLDSGLKESSQKDTSLLDRKPVLGATAVGGQLVQDMVMEPKNKEGPGLWPELSPMVLHDAGSHGPSLQSSAAKVPSWLDTAMSATKRTSLENGFSIGKISKGAGNRRSLRRCAAHVHISRLIRDLKMPEGKDMLPLQPDPLRTALDRQKQGIVMAIDDFDRVKKGLNGVISQPDPLRTALDRQKQGIVMAIDDFDRVKKGLNGVISRNNIGSSTSGNVSILQHNRLHEDNQQNTAASRVNALQKQGFDFLSLSAGGWGAAEATKSFNRTGNPRIVPSSHFQVPYLHSLPQRQSFMTHAMPQTHSLSSAYPDQLSTSTSAFSQQVHLQLPPYLSSPFLGPPHTSLAFSTKQQQQQIRAAQLAAQYRPAGTSSAMNQFPSWVNGRQDPTLLHCPQSGVTRLTPTPSVLEVPGPKYSPISQQQQQLHLVTPTSSFQPARVKRQDRHLPLVYEESEAGFQSGGAFPLQLHCNERL